MAKNRKKKRKKKRKLKTNFLQGRTFRSRSNIKILNNGLFVFEGLVYDPEDFPRKGKINLSETDVDPIGKYIPPKKEKKKKKHRKSLAAWIYSNAKECPDVQKILEERQAG